MTSAYQPIFDATQIALGRPDIDSIIRDAASRAFDISILHSRAHEAIGMIESDWRRPFVLLRPRMFIDGDMWCALYGENVQDGVAGFGKTPDAASWDFDKNWTQQAARQEPKP